MSTHFPKESWPASLHFGQAEARRGGWPIFPSLRIPRKQFKVLQNQKRDTKNLKFTTMKNSNRGEEIVDKGKSWLRFRFHLSSFLSTLIDFLIDIPRFRSK